MTNSKNTKRALLTSALSVVLCITMLVGATFAWFTDSVTNTGNRIVAGQLKVDLVMDKACNGAYTSIADGQGDIFSEAAGNGVLWEPGKTEIVYLGVQNKGSLALKYNLLLKVQDGGLIGSLEYAVLDGKKAEDLQSVTSWTDLKAQATATGDLAAGSVTAAPNGRLDEVAKGAQEETDYFALAVHMKETAGNDYQQKDVTIDLTVVATQATAESDSFDDQYDAKAFVEVASPADFIDAANSSAVMRLTQEISLEESVVFPKDTVLDLNGQTLTLPADKSLKAAPGAVLTVQGSGQVNGILYADSKLGKGGTLVVNAAEDFSVASEGGWAVYGGAGSHIVINGGTYTATKDGTSGVIHALGSSLVMKDAVVEVGVASVINAYGIYSSASETTLTNVTVNGKYSIAVDLKNAYGKAVIQGGTFITDKALTDSTPQDPAPVNPTIRYQGTLDISDASITRIGTGILYSKVPKPTSVEGLTMKNCTFTPVGANNSYLDTDFSK